MVVVVVVVVVAPLGLPLLLLWMFEMIGIGWAVGETIRKDKVRPCSRSKSLVFYLSINQSFNNLSIRVSISLSIPKISIDINNLTLEINANLGNY